MNVREAAAELEISQSAVYALCAKGLLPHARLGVGRGTIRISKDDLRAYVESRRVGQPAPAMILKHLKIRSGG